MVKTPVPKLVVTMQMHTNPLHVHNLFISIIERDILYDWTALHFLFVAGQAAERGLVSGELAQVYYLWPRTTLMGFAAGYGRQRPRQ